MRKFIATLLVTVFIAWIGHWAYKSIELNLAKKAASDAIQLSQQYESNAGVQEAKFALEQELDAKPPVAKKIRMQIENLGRCINAAATRNPSSKAHSGAGGLGDTDFAFERAAYLIHRDLRWSEDLQEYASGVGFGGGWSWVLTPPDAEGYIELKGEMLGNDGKYHVDKYFGPLWTYGEVLATLREVEPQTQPDQGFVERMARKFGRRVPL